MNGEEVGIADRNLLSRVSLKWNLSIPEVTTAIVGADRTTLSVISNPVLTENETDILEKLRTSPTFTDYSGNRLARYLGE